MNPHVRERPARSSFLRKLEILEEAVLSGTLPSNLPELRKLSDFQNWQCLSSGIGAWTNTKIMNLKGPNADLRARLAKVWPEIQRLQGRSKSPPKVGKPPAQTVLEGKVAALSLQVYKLIIERDAIREEHIRTKQQNDSLRRENKSLIERLNSVVPINFRDD